VAVGEGAGIGVNAFPAFHPSQYRNTPFRAVSVSTVVDISWRVLVMFWSHKTKKNVLLWMIGPP
jgi:hypothetical protein